MLNWSFDSKKSEETKVERLIGGSAIEPKAPRQQLTKTITPGNDCDRPFTNTRA